METLQVKVTYLELDFDGTGEYPTDTQLAIEESLEDQILEIEVNDAADDDEIHYEVTDAIETLTGYLIQALDYEVVR